MRNDVTEGTVTLPEALTGQFRAFERRLWLAETVLAAAGGFCGILLTYFLLFVSDRFWNTPVALRVGLVVAGGAVLGVFVWRWSRHWLWKRRGARQLARIVQRRYRALGDRLLGAVELSEGTGDAERVSPALCRAAVRQVAEEARRYDFTQAVERRRPRLAVLAFGVLALAVIVPFVLFPAAGWNALVRWLRPLSTVERFTFVRLEDMPEELIVAHGEPFEVACALSADSVWTPPRATCSIDDQPPVEAALRHGQALFRLPGQVKSGVLTMRVGDLRRTVRIRPFYRPELVRMLATVKLPEYLQLPSRTVRVADNRIEAPVGSTVALAGTVGRDLAAVVVEPERGMEAAVEGTGFFTPPVPIEDVGERTFSWTDRFGLSAAAGYPLEGRAVPDQAPTLRASGLGQTVAILADEVVRLELDAADDYGLRRVWVDWKTEARTEQGIPATNATDTVAEGAPDAAELNGVFVFSPVTMHVPEETMVTVVPATLDYLPGREPTRGATRYVYVLSRAQHARVLQDEMQKLQARLEDLAREEEKQIQRNAEIASRDEATRNSERTTDELRESVQAETRNKRQLAQLAGDTDKLTKEGMRNKDIGEETLRRWTEMADAMRRTAEGDMQQAAGALQQARTSQSQRDEKMSEAIAAEKRALAEMRKMESGINKSIEQMVAQSFVNRLLQAARKEDEVADTVKGLLPKVIGLSLEDLSQDMREQLNMLGARQSDNGKQVAYIRDDLHGFYNRTRMEVYNRVHQAMQDTGIVTALEALAANVRKNVGASSIDGARQWAGKLREWAELLREKGAGGGGSGGEGDGQQESVDLEVLIALMRARVRQESLREQTRLLEETREKNRRYAADAGEVSSKQYELARDTRPLERKVRVGRARTLIEKVGGEMMNAGMYLRKPQTDWETTGIQTEIIELLANAISSASGQQSSAAQSLMQAMGMGSSGGGNTSGGGTGEGGEVAGGSAAGGDGRGREVEKAGGVDRGAWPAEFRDALDAYYKALEAE